MKKNIKRLLENEKYLNRILEWYQEYVDIFGETAFDDLKNDISKYIREDEVYYDDFYEYAMSNYLPKNVMDDVVVGTHKKIIEGQNENKKVPIWYLCILYYVHLYIERQKLENQTTRTENDNHYLTQIILQFRVLGEFIDEIDDYVKQLNDILFLSDINRLDEDVWDLDDQQKRFRFFKALKNGQLKMAMRILYRIGDIPKDEVAYYEMLMALKDKTYSEGIYWAKFATKDSGFYFQSLSVLLECYAMLGDLDAFKQCLLDNKEYIFDLWNYSYLLMLLVLNVNDLENVSQMAKDIELQIKFKKEKTNYYGNVISLLTNICVEGFVILDEVLTLMASNTHFVISDRLDYRLNQLSAAMSIYTSEISKYFDVSYYTNNDFVEVRDSVVGHFVNILITEHPNQNFDDLKSALTMLYKLGYVELFLELVSKQFDAIISHAKDGNHDAKELLHLAYIEGALQNNVDQRISNYVLPNLGDLSENVKTMKAYSTLSPEGKRAFEFAEWQFKKSQEEEYGCKDAGMISLGYYRIFELELNRYIVYPLVKQVQYTNILHQYETYRDSLQDRGHNSPKKRYIKKWKDILNSIETIQNSQYTDGALMLGALDKFFRNIMYSNANNNDPLSRHSRME